MSLKDAIENDVLTEEDLKESFERLTKISAAAKDLKWGESKEIECLDCKGVLTVSRSDYNGHIWAVCENCGVKMMQ